MYAALDNGLPMVNVPVGMDQPENAARCAQLHLGVTVAHDARTAESIRAAVRKVLTDSRYRTNAERMQAAMHARPPPSEIVSLLEELARERRPVSAHSQSYAS
jgi:UDP:flavonoid glycosyltransferase YjiC (YdhE family)